MMDKFEKKEITKKSDDFSRWYTDVILKAELADYSPVRGCMVIRPYGYAIWKRVHDILDEEFIKTGHQEVYFPVFVPMSLLQKEKEHVEGFSPELAVVTHGGGEKLEEPLVVRPTSETIMYEMYKDWVSSWRDLPLLYYSWNNVVRWEKRTRLFLRTTEFLWHEGHTAHAICNEAFKEVMNILHLYGKFYQDYFAMPSYLGRKSEKEKFPGAKDTYAVECLMSDGKALQAGTSHDLGQNFSKAFAIQYQDKNGKLQHVWQTCWAISTRAIGGLVMTHGDDNGLVLPPKIAPIQVVVIPIYKNDKSKILNKANKIVKDLNTKFRVKLDDREEYSLGYKINDWELRGVPLRLEVGEKEIFENKIKAVKRIAWRGATRESYLDEGRLIEGVDKCLKDIQENLLEKADNFLKENTHEVDKYDEFKEIMKTKKGFIKAFWCENKACEEKIKEETKASTRCLPLEAKEEKGNCIYCGKPASHRWYFAQAY